MTKFIDNVTPLNAENINSIIDTVNSLKGNYVVFISEDSLIHEENIRWGDIITLTNDSPDKEGYYLYGWKYLNDVYLRGTSHKVKESRVYEAEYRECPQITYSVTDAAISGMPQYAKPDETVSFSVIPDDGYTVKSISIQTPDGTNVQCNSDGISFYSFVMPFKDAAITILTIKKTYLVAVKAISPIGIINDISATFSPALEDLKAIWDEVYDMTITLPRSYTLVNIAAEGVTFIKKSDNVYGFTMPKHAIAIVISVE